MRQILRGRGQGLRRCPAAPRRQPPANRSPMARPMPRAAPVTSAARVDMPPPVDCPFRCRSGSFRAPCPARSSPRCECRRDPRTRSNSSRAQSVSVGARMTRAPSASAVAWISSTSTPERIWKHQVMQADAARSEGGAALRRPAGEIAATGTPADTIENPGLSVGVTIPNECSSPRWGTSAPCWTRSAGCARCR